MKRYGTLLLGIGAVLAAGLLLTGCAGKDAGADAQEGAVQVENVDTAGPQTEEDGGNAAETPPSDGAAGEETPVDGEDGGETSAAPEKQETELTGSILSLEGDSFVISRIETTTYEDGTQLCVSASPGSEDQFEKVTVKYTQATPVTVRTITGRGAAYTDREGSSEDLKAELMVELEGGYEGEEFQADSIRVVIVE